MRKAPDFSAHMERLENEKGVRVFTELLRNSYSLVLCRYFATAPLAILQWASSIILYGHLLRDAPSHIDSTG